MELQKKRPISEKIDVSPRNQRVSLFRLNRRIICGGLPGSITKQTRRQTYARSYATRDVCERLLEINAAA